MIAVTCFLVDPRRKGDLVLEFALQRVGDGVECLLEDIVTEELSRQGIDYLGTGADYWVCDPTFVGRSIIDINFLCFVVQVIAQNSDGDVLGDMDASITLHQKTKEPKQRNWFLSIVGLEGKQ